MVDYVIIRKIMTILGTYTFFEKIRQVTYRY